jgi:hypothetical protein
LEVRPSEQLSWVEVSSDWAAMAAFFVPEVFNVKTTSKAAPSKSELMRKTGLARLPPIPWLARSNCVTCCKCSAKNASCPSTLIFSHKMI